MKIWYYNPENDLALANGDKNYHPSNLSYTLKSDLELLPYWFKDPDDLVMTNDNFNDIVNNATKYCQFYPW